MAIKPCAMALALFQAPLPLLLLQDKSTISSAVVRLAMHPQDSGVAPDAAASIAVSTGGLGQ
jgi:hypothetical protein